MQRGGSEQEDEDRRGRFEEARIGGRREVQADVAAEDEGRHPGQPEQGRGQTAGGACAGSV
jgi:hypothetical protein